MVQTQSPERYEAESQQVLLWDGGCCQNIELYVCSMALWPVLYCTCVEADPPGFGAVGGLLLT